MRALIAVLLLLTAAEVFAQVQSRTTDAPIVTADNESWYLLGEPLQFAGDLYYRAGPAVFFNGYTMVRSGHYNGVPLYTDTTLEPYSIVYVPIRRGLMQPYERLRRGDLAGTTGSRTPSFPVALVPDRGSLPMAATAPTNLPQPIGAISAYTPEAPPAPRSIAEVVAPAPEAPVFVRPPEQPGVTLLQPESNDGIWVSFLDERWVSAGAAVVYSEAEFVRVGEYAGFPVYARQGLKEDVIYIPTLDGLVAPYRLKR